MMYFSVVHGVLKLMDSGDAQKMVNFVATELYLHEVVIKTLCVCACVLDEIGMICTWQFFKLIF
jgi:hypothetical protein